MPDPRSDARGVWSAPLTNEWIAEIPAGDGVLRVFDADDRLVLVTAYRGFEPHVVQTAVAEVRNAIRRIDARGAEGFAFDVHPDGLALVARVLRDFAAANRGGVPRHQTVSPFG